MRTLLTKYLFQIWHPEESNENLVLGYNYYYIDNGDVLITAFNGFY